MLVTYFKSRTGIIDRKVLKFSPQFVITGKLRKNDINSPEGLLVLKVYKISAKKVHSSYVSWYWWVVQNLKSNWFFVSKMPRICWSLVRALKSLKNCALIGPFWAKYITFDLKKHRGVLFRETGESCKVWKKKLTYGLENVMWNLANFHKNTWKCQNWYFPFVQSRKFVS